MIVYLNTIKTLITGFSDIHYWSACDAILVFTLYDYIPTSSCRICYCKNSNPKALSMIFYLDTHHQKLLYVWWVHPYFVFYELRSQLKINLNVYLQYQNINRLVESSSSQEASNNLLSRQIPHAQITKPESRSCQDFLLRGFWSFFF